MERTLTSTWGSMMTANISQISNRRSVMKRTVLKNPNPVITLLKATWMETWKMMLNGMSGYRMYTTIFLSSPIQQPSGNGRGRRRKISRR
uniref:Uncharacterized protein n=1 Tax=uncultured marine virus TaxID=186617 RepID=A0A0F7L6R7_9VIRU|nr:hypothetical protein [uncultured marine virus]